MPAALNLQPLKKKDIKNLANHYARRQQDPPVQVDKSRSKHNLYWPSHKGIDAAADALASYGQDGKHPDGKKLRADARYAAAVVLTLPLELHGRGDDVLMEWARASVAFAHNKMPGKVVARALHMDETTPHIHVLIDVRDDAGKLAYRKLYGHPNILREIQSEYSKALEPLGVRPSDPEEKHQRRAGYVSGIHGWRAGRALRSARRMKMEAAAMLRRGKEALRLSVETDAQAKARAERWAAGAKKWASERGVPNRPPTAAELTAKRKRRTRGGGGPGGP